MTDHRAYAPACARNKDPILDVLQGILDDTAYVLEIAAGTGEHAVHFTDARPGWRWQPTDIDDAGLRSQRAWADHVAHDRVLPAKHLSVLETNWADVLDERQKFDAVYCCNMIHISPWACTPALFAGAAAVTTSDAVLATYGPYKVNGAHTADSNARFEAWLHDRSPEFGVRDLADVYGAAEQSGWICKAQIDMPANNKMLIFKKNPQ